MPSLSQAFLSQAFLPLPPLPAYRFAPSLPALRPSYGQSCGCPWSCPWSCPCGCPCRRRRRRRHHRRRRPCRYIRASLHPDPSPPHVAKSASHSATNPASQPAARPARPAHPLLTDRATQAAFLRTRWNKAPTLFRAVFPPDAPPLTASELAGLATHASDARIILGAHPGPYELRLGPFAEDTFARLPTVDWTLLLHGAERYVPQLALLQDAFSFVPAWRGDDVMVSYAVTGGGVGPHVDNYDVFLVQGDGERVWRTGGKPISVEEEVLLEDCDVRVLRDGFECANEWRLTRGDVLYVPPRFAHHGVALDDQCMTFSVGFRAPERGQLARGWVEEVLREGQEKFYEDEAEDLVKGLGDRGRISEGAIDNAYALVVDAMKESKDGKRAFRDWFAREVTKVKQVSDDDEFGSLAEEDVERMVNLVMEGEEAVTLRQQEGYAFSYLEGDEGIFLYAAGEKWQVDSLRVATTICGARTVQASVIAELAKQTPSVRGLLRELLTAELMYVDDGLPIDDSHCEDENEGRADSSRPAH